MPTGKYILFLMIFALLFSCSSQDNKVGQSTRVSSIGKNTPLPVNKAGKNATYAAKEERTSNTCESGYVFLQFVHNRKPIAGGSVAIKLEKEGEEEDENTFDVIYQQKKGRLIKIPASGQVCLNKDSLAKAHKIQLRDTLRGFYIGPDNKGMRFKIPLAEDSISVSWYFIQEGNESLHKK